MRMKEDNEFNLLNEKKLDPVIVTLAFKKWCMRKKHDGNESDVLSDTSDKVATLKDKKVRTTRFLTT